MNRLMSLGGFLLIVLITVIFSGQYVGGQWYQDMHQPDWNPSAIVMALIWAVMYVLMAVSAWMVWENRHGTALISLGWWGFQLLLGITWSVVFFGMHRIGWALGVISLWLIVTLIVLNAFRFVKKEASAAMLPVAIWMVFLWSLNFVQWHLNGGGSG